MFIRYLGHACFFLRGEYSVVIDPHQGVGYPLERVSADFALSSHSHFDHNAIDLVDCKIAISTEEEVKKGEKISLSAISSFHDEVRGEKRGENLIFSFVIDGISFTHLGDLGEDFSEELVEKIPKTDVLFIPVGGTYTIDSQEAFKFAKAIGAKITVPMHFKTPRSTVDVGEVGEFLKLFEGFEVVKGVLEVKKENLGENRVILFDHSDF